MGNSCCSQKDPNEEQNNVNIVLTPRDQKGMPGAFHCNHRRFKSSICSQDIINPLEITEQPYAPHRIHEHNGSVEIQTLDKSSNMDERGKDVTNHDQQLEEESLMSGINDGISATSNQFLHELNQKTKEGVELHSYYFDLPLQIKLPQCPKITEEQSSELEEKAPEKTGILQDRVSSISRSHRVGNQKDSQNQMGFQDQLHQDHQTSEEEEEAHPNDSPKGTDQSTDLRKTPDNEQDQVRHISICDLPRTSTLKAITSQNEYSQQIIYFDEYVKNRSFKASFAQSQSDNGRASHEWAGDYAQAESVKIDTFIDNEKYQVNLSRFESDGSDPRSLQMIGPKMIQSVLKQSFVPCLKGDHEKDDFKLPTETSHDNHALTRNSFDRPLKMQGLYPNKSHYYQQSKQSQSSPLSLNHNNVQNFNITEDHQVQEVTQEEDFSPVKQTAPASNKRRLQPNQLHLDFTKKRSHSDNVRTHRSQLDFSQENKSSEKGLTTTKRSSCHPENNENNPLGKEHVAHSPVEVNQYEREIAEYYANKLLKAATLMVQSCHEPEKITQVKTNEPAENDQLRGQEKVFKKQTKLNIQLEFLE